MSIFEIFSYGFMLRAFLAGIGIGVVAPVIGLFLVARRYSVMADTLAHVSLAGVALGLLLGIYPVYTAVGVTVGAALLLEKMRTKRNISGDKGLAVFLSGGLAIAVVLMGLVKRVNVDLLGYLFGSITTVTRQDVWLIGLLGVGIITIVAVFYKELMYIAFDEEAAKVSGLPTQAFNMLLVVLTAVVVSISMRIVGVLLIGALMVIPVITAMQLKRSFLQTLGMSVAISVTSVIVGLLVSYYLNLAAGGSIVLISLLFFGGVTLTSRSR